MDPVLSAIDEALRRAGLTDAAASKLAVGNYSLIKNMRADRGVDKRYTFQSLQELARVLGLECYFGPKREFRGFSESGLEVDLGGAEALRAGYLPIPWHDAARRRGSAPIALQATWLASEGIIPDHLRAVMPDNLQLSVADSGKTVAILDTTAAQRGSSGLWCYTDDGKVSVGRVAFAEKVIVLLSLDEDDGPIRVIEKPAPKTFTVLGKVIWLGSLMP